VNGATTKRVAARGWVLFGVLGAVALMVVVITAVLPGQGAAGAASKPPPAYPASRERAKHFDVPTSDVRAAPPPP